MLLSAIDGRRFTLGYLSELRWHAARARPTHPRTRGVDLKLYTDLTPGERAATVGPDG